MFKYKDHYYFTGSDLYGWRGSEFMFSSRKIYLAITSSSPIMLTLQKQALTFRT